MEAKAVLQNRMDDQLQEVVRNPRERSVEEAVKFSIQSVRELLGWLPGEEAYLQGKTILEVGPGQDLGVPMILMGFGAHCIVVDRYLSEWDQTFHPFYYEQLRETVVQHFPAIKIAAIDEVIEAGAHCVSGIKILRTGLEAIDEIPDQSVDVSYSNAVLEHLEGPYVAVQQLYRITRPGGFGFHQVDFRDHRDFCRPLEYLTITKVELEGYLKDSCWTSGNALRFCEFQTCFEVVGFATRFEPNLFADGKYLRDVRTRIVDPRYRAMPIDALRILAGRFSLEKRPRARDMAEAGSTVQVLWDALVDLDVRLLAAHARIAEHEQAYHYRRLETELREARRQLRRYERIGADRVVGLARVLKRWAGRLRTG